MASTTAQTSLSGVSSSGAGTTVDFTDARRNVTAVLTRSGTVTGGVVQVQASHDGLNWVTLYYFDPVISTNQHFSNTAGAFRYWRGVVARDLAGGGSASMTFMEADR